MIYKQATQYLKNWIENFLDKPHPAFNDYSPCPFAKKSLEESKVIFLFCNEATFPKNLSMAGYDVVVYIFEKKIDYETMLVLVREFNKNNPTLVALEDHPDEEERIESCVLNNGKYCTIFIQSREKLEKFRNNLQKTSYYNNWPADYLDDVINR